MMFGYLGTYAKDIKTTICLDMICIILGEGSSSRLYQNLIEKRTDNVFNLVDSEHYLFKDGGNFFVQSNFDANKKELAIELIKEELEKLKSDITESELNKAKKKIKSRFAAESETVSDIGELIGYYMTVCDDLKPVEDYIELIEQVTVEDLHETVKKYLDVNNAVISVLLPNTLANV